MTPQTIVPMKKRETKSRREVSKEERAGKAPFQMEILARRDTHEAAHAIERSASSALEGLVLVPRKLGISKSWKQTGKPGQKQGGAVLS